MNLYNSILAVLCFAVLVAVYALGYFNGELRHVREERRRLLARDHGQPRFKLDEPDFRRASVRDEGGPACAGARQEMREARRS